MGGLPGSNRLDDLAAATARLGDGCTVVPSVWRAWPKLDRPEGLLSLPGRFLCTLVTFAAQTTGEDAQPDPN